MGNKVGVGVVDVDIEVIVVSNDVVDCLVVGEFDFVGIVMVVGWIVVVVVK